MIRGGTCINVGESVAAVIVPYLAPTLHNTSTRGVKKLAPLLMVLAWPE